MATNKFYSDATSRVDQLIQDYYGSEQNLMKSLEFQPIDVASNAGVFNSKLEGFFARRRAAQNKGYLTKRTRVQPGEQFIKRDTDGRNIVKSFKIRTIYDMMRVDYPHIYSDDMLNAITKADAPYLSSTTAMYNAVHGAEAVHQIIQEDNVRRLLPKVPYLRGGVRFITAAGTTSGVGIAENAAVPDTVKATLANVDYGIKERSYSFNVSARMEFLSMLEDDAWSQGGGAFAAARYFAQLEFNKTLNRELTTNVTTLAGNNFESIDRVVSSYAEVNSCGDIDANDSDIYGINRDAGATYADAYVNHNSNTDRDLTLDLCKDVLENVQPNWGGPEVGGQPGNYENKIWLTGYDTKNVIEQIFEEQNTYRNNGMRVSVGMNGVQTLPYGSEAGMLVNTLYGIPLFVSDDVPASGAISNLYLLDLNHLKMGVGIPPMYFEAGFSKGTVGELDAFQNLGIYYEMGELLATRFNVHGKIRDLQA